MFSATEILDLAIQLEKNGESVYRNAIEEITAPELVSLLVWMADEEVSHARWFADLKEKEESVDEKGFEQELSGQLLSSLMGEKSFSLDEIDFSKVTQINHLIELFIEFEKDTILFYEILEPFIQNRQTRTQLKSIISEEQKHVDQLRGIMVNGAELFKNIE